MKVKYSELRKVAFTMKHFDPTAQPMSFSTNHTGRFHQWGRGLAKNQEVVTVAIVEDQEGKIHIVQPGDLQFLDSKTHKLVDGGMSDMEASLQEHYDEVFDSGEKKGSEF